MKSFLFILMACASAAHAEGYHCKLPLNMLSQLKNGTPHSAVVHDQTVNFQVRIIPPGKEALIEGELFTIIEIPKMKSFVSMAQSGGDFNIGGFDVLSIYGIRVEGGFYAAEARHILINGAPMAELFVGACSPT